jgi:hypothetical protein
MAEAVAIELLALAKQRFFVNIARVNALTEHALTLPIDGDGDDRERRALLVADLLRTMTVFLYVTFEDLLRSLQGKKSWSFSGRADLERALRRLSLDPAEFRDLIPCLQSLARARINIVHYADFHTLHEAVPDPRNILSLWLSGHRVLGGAAFFHRLMHRLGPTSMVEDRARENAERAFVENISIARAIIDAPTTSPEERLRHFQTIGARLDGLLDILKLTPEMFIDEDGNLIPGAVESLPLL